MTNDSVTIEYFGAAAFKITTDKGKRILIDPYITKNTLCKKKLDYFYDADLILVSHGATDHRGDVIEIMKYSQALLICGADVRKHALKMGIPKERVKSTIYGDVKEFAGIRIKCVDARHTSKVEVESETIYGMPLGFIVSTENDISIYHTGDTALFGDLQIYGQLYRPNILLILISSFAEDVAQEMQPNEAALATLWVAPDIVVPMHYPAGSDKPAEFLQAVKVMAPKVQPVLIEPGGRIVYTKYRVEAE